MKKPIGNNERGRITGMPGTAVSVTLYPQRLGVRMRNRIIRMLENRVIEGGWSSESRRLAMAIAEKHGIQCSNHHWNGMQILGLSAEAAPHVREAVHADWTAYLLERPEYRRGYYKDSYNKAMECLDACDQNFYMNVHDKGSIRKVVEILTEHTTQEMKDKSKQVADMLRGTEPIHLITF